MASQNLAIDENMRNTLGAVTNDSNEFIERLRINPISGALVCTAVITSSNTSIGSTIPGGTQGSVLFIGPGATLAQDNTEFFWDDTNHFLGLGTNTPAATLDIEGTFKYTDGTQANGFVLTSDGVGNATWQAPSGGGSGTVTSISGLDSISLTPNPITTTGTVKLVGDVVTPTNGQFYGYSGGNRGWFTPSGSSGITSINGDTTAAQIIDNTDTLITITQPLAGTTRLAINVANLAADNTFVADLVANTTFLSDLASSTTFVNDLIANTTFTTNLANNSNFITTITTNSTFLSDIANSATFISDLTSNSTFQTDITNIVNNPLTNPDAGKVFVDGSDTTLGFLDPKINIHSSDASITVTKTITNPSGNEILDYDLTVGVIPVLGAWSSPITAGTPYQATTDGFVTAYAQASVAFITISIKTDSSSTPTTLRQEQHSTSLNNNICAMCPVRNGDYVEVDVTGGGTVTSTIYWIPLT